jgi:hypothetical protein
MRSRRNRALIVAIVVLAYATATIIARRRGYGVGGNATVRCRAGHLFTTLWVPGASVKAVRLGWFRFQWCPVGRHWTMVHPVRGADLTDDERERAAAIHDIRIP